MKVLVVLALYVACAQAGSISDIGKKFIPSFATGYIIKGEDAKAHAAPYIVSLSKNREHSHICGGTIISKQWILTAAHCISEPVGMSVVAGLHERTTFDDKIQKREVDFGRVHEQYSGGVGPYDIAILRVSQPFEFTEWVQPAVLPAPEELHDGTTHLYGWGQPKSYVFSGAKTLQTVETEIVEWNECKSILPENAPIHETNVCSDSKQQSISACNGDSGGPLVIEHENSPTELIGIVSWGYIPCGYAQRPSIYTRVSAYIDWISKIENAYYALY